MPSLEAQEAPRSWTYINAVTDDPAEAGHRMWVIIERAFAHPDG